MGYKQCCMVGCFTSKDKCRGISFHAIKRKKNKDWERMLIRSVSRKDKLFNPENAVICSRHFEETCFKPGKTEFERILIDGSIPTLNLAKKIYSKPPKPRKPPMDRTTMMDTDDSNNLDIDECNSKSYVENHVKFTLPDNWVSLEKADYTDLMEIKNFKVTRCLRIHSNMSTNAEIYLQGQFSHTVSLGDRPFQDILNDLTKLELCLGISDLFDVCQGQTYFVEQFYDPTKGKIMKYIKSKKCMLAGKNGLCKECRRVKSYLKKSQKKKLRTKNKPIAKRGSLSTHGKSKLAKALKLQRKNNMQLAIKVKSLSMEISKKSVTVSNSFHTNLREIMEQQKITNPMCKIFWEEQIKSQKQPGNSHKWHPMMIKLAIMLHSQSPAAYRSLRETGVVKLPGESTIRDYTNFINPSQGFNVQVLKELKTQADKLPQHQRYVVIMHDEMAIKSDLVYSERSGSIIGTAFDGCLTATHVLVFMVVGIVSSFKFSLAYFGTTGVSAHTLFALFWEAVCHVEQAGLKVIASVADKAASNQKFIQLHGSAAAQNMFSDEERLIYFLSDAPHLIKTLRNNLFNSGSGKNSRHLWNNGKDLLWSHVRDVYKEDSKHELRRTKLTAAHIYLNSYSLMKVNLASQVMSASVGNILKSYGTEEVTETSKFIILVDRIFDCLNTRSDKEAHRKRKPDLLPYCSLEDPRFEFLEHEVPAYFKAWKESISNRNVLQHQQFSKRDQERMFISHQTFKALTSTVKSMVALIKFLLAEGLTNICTRNLNQDPLESHFGMHRMLGRRTDNPTLYQYGYQENKLRIQRSVAAAIRPKGNIKGEKGQIQISSSPVKKIRR